MQDIEEDKILIGKIQNGIEDGIELDHLKKINRKINLLHIIIFAMIFIIIIIFIIGLIKYSLVNSIIKKTYVNLQSLSQSDNYKIIKDTIYINLETRDINKGTEVYFYNNGKCKLEFNYKHNDLSYSTTQFLEDNSYNSVMIYHNLKTIEEITSNHINLKKGEPFRTFANIYSYSSLDGLASVYFKLGFSIRTDYFNGEECYVIRSPQSSNNSYRDTWISKERNITVREVENFESYYQEVRYTLLFDETTTEEVDFSDVLEEYNDYYVKTISIDDKIGDYYDKLVREND